MKNSEEKVSYIFSKNELKKSSNKVIYYSFYILLFIGAAISLFPFIWMIISSFKMPQEVFKFPPTLIPEHFNFDSYKKIFMALPFLRWFFNSIFVSSSIVFLQIFILSLAAYSISKLNLPYKRGILLLFLSSMMIPFQIKVIPLYLIMRYFPAKSLFGINLPTINLLDTYWALILPSIVDAFNLFLLKGFFDGIPDSIMESARIDGASEWQIFQKIILPLSKSVFAVVGIFAFIGAWDAFLWPLIVLSKPKMYTLMLGVQKYASGFPEWNTIMALSTVTVLPIIILFIFLQKYILKGISLTGLKE